MTQESAGFNLVIVFADIPDFRKSRGKRHPLCAILVMACVAILCGYRSYAAIAEWGGNYKEFANALGFRGNTPCAATFFRAFRQIDLAAFCRKIFGFTQSITTGVRMAIDGETLRGSLKQGSEQFHLLSAADHECALPLAQVSVDGKTNEIGKAEEILKQIDLKGKITTSDALLTQTKISEAILEGGGDYVMTVKRNQLGLYEDVKTLFSSDPVEGETRERASSIDLGHGRIEEGEPICSDALKDYLDWPGAERVFKIVRKRTMKKDGSRTEETVYGITSCSREKLGVEELLETVRGRWSIENRCHWVRDVVFEEDRSQVGEGNVPSVMATLRSMTTGLMRRAGRTKIAQACRYYAARPKEALNLIGI